MRSPCCLSCSGRSRRRGAEAFGAVPSARQHTALLWSFLGAGGSLLAWIAALFITARSAKRTLSLEVILRTQHYVQACAQLTIFVYWGW